MGTHRGQPGDEPDEDDGEQPLGSALRHPNRTHVTLANLADLNLSAFASKTEAGTEQGTEPGADQGAGPGNGHLPASNGSWLSQLPTPVEEPPRARRRDRDEAGDGGEADAHRPGEHGALARSGENGTAGVPVIVPDAVSRSPAAAVVVPGRAKLPGAYGETTGEHRAWVIPSARVPGAGDDPDAPKRTGWARLLERWLLELVALTVAAVAFVIPAIWLVVVVIGTVVGAIVAFVASGSSPASLPAHVARRSVELLRPRSLVWVPVFTARTIIAAVVLPAAVVAFGWYLRQGTEGAVAAARAGAWNHGFRVAAVLLCVMLLTSVGDGRQNRAATVRRWARPATDGTLSILAASCVALVALVVVAAPHPRDGVAARADGLGWVPGGARAGVDRLRDDIVTSELDSLASCLSKRGGTIWKPFYTAENPLDEPDVARLVASREPAFSPPADLVTAILAAHNQLAPWVEAIEVEWPGGDLVRTERATLSRREPLVDVEPLVPATTNGAQWVSTGLPDSDIILRCSAAPVL